MARPFWKGSLSFGLVEIPVSLHRATESQEVSLTMLDQKDFSPVGFRRYNKNTGEEVPWERIVRGYPHEDEYVVLNDEDLKRANAEASQTIEIMAFVERDAIEPIYYETPYYVEPQKRGSKSYALLREALERSGRVGIARVVLRVRQHLAALIVRGEALMLDLVRYAHEIRSTEGLDFPPKRSKTTGVSAQELEMAEQLIEGMSGTWDPARYRDEYRDDLEALVERRVREGKTHTITKPGEPKSEPRAREVVDLLPLLKESLAKRLGSRAVPKRAERADTESKTARRRAAPRRHERRRTKSA